MFAARATAPALSTNRTLGPDRLAIVLAPYEVRREGLVAFILASRRREEANWQMQCWAAGHRIAGQARADASGR